MNYELKITDQREIYRSYELQVTLTLTLTQTFSFPLIHYYTSYIIHHTSYIYTSYMIIDCVNYPLHSLLILMAQKLGPHMVQKSPSSCLLAL